MGKAESELQEEAHLKLGDLLPEADDQPASRSRASPLRRLAAWPLGRAHARGAEGG